MAARFEHVPYASQLCKATIDALYGRREMPSDEIAALADDEMWLWEEYISPMLRAIEVSFQD